jgi:hypothetical protein
MNIADLGKILKSGWGTYPPENIILHMLEEYGFKTPKKTE